MPEKTNTAQVLYRHARYGKWKSETVVIPEGMTMHDDRWSHCVTRIASVTGKAIVELKIENIEALD